MTTFFRVLNELDQEVGVYPTYEEAQEHATWLQRNFDMDARVEVPGPRLRDLA